MRANGVLNIEDTPKLDRLSSPTRLLFQSVASTGARLTSTVAILLTISLAAHRMSPEEFGLWAILLTFMFLAMTFDLGFRYGLSNRLAALAADRTGRRDPEQLTMFLSVFAAQTAIAVCGAIGCLCVLPHLPWACLFSIHQPDLAAQVSTIVPVAGSLLFLYLPFSLWATPFYAHQEINLASALSGAQSLVMLTVFTATVFTLPFRLVVLIYFATYVLTGAILTAGVFIRRSWMPHWVSLTEQTRRLGSISRPSLEFFVLSLSAALTASAGAFFAGNVSGLKEAGEFSLVQKMFGLLVTLHLAFLSPLGPAYTRHAQLGEWDWVRQKLTTTVRRTWPLVFLGGGALFLALHPAIIRVWAGKSFADFTLAGILALWALAMGWTNTYSVALNSLGLVRLQAAVYVVMIVPVLVLPLILGRWCGWGINGVAAASLICALPAALVWPAYTARALREERLRV